MHVTINDTKMNEDKIMDKMHKQLLKQYHTLCSILKMSREDKVALLSGYNVESSRDLSQHQLVDLCAHLSKLIAETKGVGSMDVQRKRLIGVIGSYIELRGGDRYNQPLIKAIACRAAGVESFNAIPRQRLQSLYNAFAQQCRDMRTARQLDQHELSALTHHQTGTSGIEDYIRKHLK